LELTSSVYRQGIESFAGHLELGTIWWDLRLADLHLADALVLMRFVTNISH